MAENVRIKYEVIKKQLEEANKELSKLQKNNDLTQKEVDQTTKKFKDQDKQLASTNKEFAGLGGQLTSLGNRFSIAGKGLGDMAGGMVKAAKATTVMSGALKVFKVALLSTGIGALVVALGSLIAYFTRTQRGADKLSQVMAGIGAIVDVVIDRFSAFGEKIVGVFTPATKQATSFKDILTQTAIVAVAVVGGLGAVKQLMDVIMEASNEGAAAAELEKRSQVLRDREIALIVTKEKLRKEIAASRLAVEQEQLAGESLAESNARRYAAAQEGINAQNQLSEIELSLARERASILQAQLDLGENLTNQDRELAETKADIIRIETQRDETLKRLITRQNAFNEIAKNTALTEEEALQAKQEAEEEYLQGILERWEQEKEVNQERIDAIEAELEAEFAAIDALEAKEEEARKKKEDAEKAAADKEKLIALQTETEKQAIRNGGLAALKSVAAEGTLVAKAAGIAEVFISTRQAVAKAYSLSPATFGLPWSAFFAAQGILSASKIAGINPKFEQGGRIGGGLHSQGGTIIEAERDEFVMSRRATAKYGFDFMDKINNLELKDITAKGQGSMVNIIDVEPIARQLKNMPQNNINIDGDGFTMNQRKGQDIIRYKLSRYST